jgi:nucleotide-binding universal stress UspA family protein
MFKRILVPVDGGAVSNLGLRQAIKLCALEGAQLRLVHVVDEMPPVAMDGDMGMIPDTIPALREGARRVLARAAAAAKRAGIAAEISMIECMGGSTAEFIVSEAKKWRADVIVLGTHGRSGLERAFMGSAAEDIIRTTPVPVLLVRARDEGEKAAATGRRKAAEPALTTRH